MRVLIVENYSSLRTIVRRKLNSMSMFSDIDETTGVETAWTYIQSNSYDLVICDLTLSDMSGLELIKRCRTTEGSRFIPFVMMGNEADVHGMASALGEWEANDYIVKPFSLGTLESRILRVLEKVGCAEERLYKQIRSLKENGRIDDALGLINREEVQSRLNMARWTNLKGECLAKAGDHEAAVETFEQAIQMCDLMIAAYKNCADVNVQMGKMDDAISLLKAAEHISPTDTERSLQLGELLLKEGHVEECRSHFAQLRARNKLYGKNVAVDKQIANLFIEHDLQSDAETIYTDIIDNELDIENYNALGIIYRKQGKYKEAEGCYRKALMEYPDHPTLYYNLAVLCFVQNGRSEATQYAAKALALDPEHTLSRQLLQRIEQGSVAPSQNTPQKTSKDENSSKRKEE